MALFNLFNKKGPLKQSIVVRKDLGMGQGKQVAQGSHASLSSFLKVQHENPEIANRWLEEGQKKICLKVDGERELVEMFQKCKDAGIPCELIQDAGHTQLDPGTKTAFAAGPWNEEQLDKLLGKLKLL